jgi:hypothetical protein
MSIKFTAGFGDSDLLVELGQPHGGGEAWYISVNRYHYGVLLYRHEGWQYSGYGIKELSDVLAILERIQQAGYYYDNFEVDRMLCYEYDQYQLRLKQ